MQWFGFNDCSRDGASVSALPCSPYVHIFTLSPCRAIWMKVISGQHLQLQDTKEGWCWRLSLQGDSSKGSPLRGPWHPGKVRSLRKGQLGYGGNFSGTAWDGRKKMGRLGTAKTIRKESVLRYLELPDGSSRCIFEVCLICLLISYFHDLFIFTYQDAVCPRVKTAVSKDVAGCCNLSLLHNPANILLKFSQIAGLMRARCRLSFTTFSLLEIRIVTCKWQLFLCLPVAAARQSIAVPSHPSCLAYRRED